MPKKPPHKPKNRRGKPQRAGATPLRVLGKHPDDAGDVALYKGQYGPYVKHGKINATLLKGADLDTFTLEEALPLLAARADAPKKGFKKKAPAKAKTKKAS